MKNYILLLIYVTIRSYAQNIPNDPTNLTLSNISTHSITLNWQDNSNTETNFYIEREIPTSGSWSKIAEVDSNVVTYTNTDLNYYTNYCYRVRAYNSIDETYSVNYSNTASAYTLLAEVINLTVIANNPNELYLSWELLGEIEIGGNFGILRSLGDESEFEFYTFVNKDVFYFNNTGLLSNTEYCYLVFPQGSDCTALPKINYQNVDGEVCAITLPDIPNSPSNLMLNEVNYNSITLNWQDNSNTETHYYIERKTSSSSFSKISEVNANVTNFTDNSVSPNTQYCYRVRAFNSNGGTLSDYSNETCATTEDDPTGIDILTVALIY